MEDDITAVVSFFGPHEDSVYILLLLHRLLTMDPECARLAVSLFNMLLSAFFSDNKIFLQLLVTDTLLILGH